MKMFRNILMLVFDLLVVSALKVWSIASDGADYNITESDPNRTVAHYFILATSSPKAPDADSFLQRWLLLEPINKPNRSNTVFADSYVRNALYTDYFPDQFTVVPNDGDKVTVENQERK